MGLIDTARPPLTLAQHAIELAEEYMVLPSGPAAGQPLRLTAEQVEVLWAWYAVTANGRHFVSNRSLLLRMAKGWAKSPIGAVIAFNELVGEVVPDGLDEHGRPVGRPHPAPWYQIVANSEDQTDNLYMQLYNAIADGPAVDDFRLDVGLTRIQFRHRPGLVEPVTSSAVAREGQPISGAAIEEPHLMTVSNGGVALERTVRRNAIKFNARLCYYTNAFVPNAGSVAERLENQIARGRGAGVLAVIREADPPADDDQLRDPAWVGPQLAKVYGLAALSAGGWIDTARMVQEFVEAADDELPMLRRFFLNQVVAPEEHALDSGRWKGLVTPGAELAAGDVIGIGFDGSESGDASALYACRWPDWTVFKLGVWERPVDEDTGQSNRRKAGWRVPRGEVKSRIREVCATYRVVRGYADDAGWQSEIDELNGEFGKSFMRFPHRIDQRIGPAAERWSTMVGEGTLHHDGDEVLPRHAANARRVPIGKPQSGWWRPTRRVEGQPIDALSAAISAVHALGDAVAADEVKDVSPPAGATAKVEGQVAGDREVFRPTERLKL